MLQAFRPTSCTGWWPARSKAICTLSPPSASMCVLSMTQSATSSGHFARYSWLVVPPLVRWWRHELTHVFACTVSWRRAEQRDFPSCLLLRPRTWTSRRVDLIRTPDDRRMQLHPAKWVLLLLQCFPECDMVQTFRCWDRVLISKVLFLRKIHEGTLFRMSVSCYVWCKRLLEVCHHPPPLVNRTMSCAARATTSSGSVVLDRPQFCCERPSIRHRVWCTLIRYMLQRHASGCYRHHLEKRVNVWCFFIWVKAEEKKLYKFASYVAHCLPVPLNVCVVSLSCCWIVNASRV